MKRVGFIALAGEPSRLSALLSTIYPNRLTSPRLNRVLDCPDLIVFAAPETPILPLDEQRGLIIGRMFNRDDSRPRERLTVSQGRHAAWSGGRTLLAESWGQYVALLRDEGAVTVLRDPSAGVPAHHFRRDDVDIFFSDPELGQEFGVHSRPIDEDFLRQWLSFPFLRSSRTGLIGVTEILPGTARTLRAGGVGDAALWTPWQHATGGPQNFDEAARQVRVCLLATVPAQLRTGEPPILELSGGLDSSIVAACLGTAGLPFLAANFVTRMADGDERDYAGAVAEALGAPFQTLEEDDLPLDLDPPGTFRLRPPLSPVLQPLHRAFRGMAQCARAGTFATGAGGDNLFCYLTTASPALDAYRDRGPRQGLSTLFDIAARAECTIWTAAAFALRKRRSLARRSAWQRNARFLAENALAGLPDPHPWLDAPPDSRPGKIEHVASLVRAFHFLDPDPAAPQDCIHPLLNQPLMELCLGIPTWLWVKGGRDRAVARAAFAGLLPEKILNRRTKGRLESMCARAYDDNKGRLSTLLLDGALAARGLLDLSELRAYLEAPERARGDAYFRVFDLVSLELWLRSLAR